MNRFLKILNVILIAALLLTIGYIAGKKYTLAFDENHHPILIKHSSSEEKLRRIFNIIDNQYVENVNTDSLLDATLNSMLTQLDPHSVYLSSKNGKDALTLESSYVGVGLQYQSIRDTLSITHIFPNSSAQKKCWIGDKIISVNGISAIETKENKNNTIFPDSQQTYQIKLLRNNKTVVVTLQKNSIYIPAVQAYFMLNSSIGYIRLDRFSKNASQEVHNALLSLQKQGMKKLIFDVRDNPGGLLHEAEKITDEFLPKGKLMVYIEDKNKKRDYLYATNSGVFENKPIYVLINENSASASEVLAGALQDNDAATIVGRRSFGKGLVQREISLGDGSTLRLTTANYFTPTGRNIQKPYKNQKDYYLSDMLDRIHSGELYDKSKIKLIDSLKKKTPKGKIVFGGGGITPDVFVSMQQFEMSYEFYEQEGFLHTQEFMLNYIQKNEAYFRAMNSEEFIQKFQAKSIQKEYESYLKLKKIELNSSQIQSILVFVKAQMGRMLYDEQTYHKIWFTEDTTLKHTLQIANQNP